MVSLLSFHLVEVSASTARRFEAISMMGR